MTRLPRQFYFSGGYIRFFIENKKPKYMIFNQILTDSSPIYQTEGDYTGQDLNELAKPYVLEPQYKRILKQ